MKPEEAIDYLQDPIGKREKHDEAIQMAIEALKAQLSNHSEIPNSSDTISRREAIDAIKTSRYLVDAMEKIIRLPSAQPEPHWIPCSERLPDTNRDVLLQFNNNMGVGFWENGEWGVNTGDNIYSEIGEGEEKPIAWMELPEPYKGES